ncbi:YbaB/EbfC family nucleoid-associated protein [Planosporangium sp. 12N6]|uniref:YbaB/EbfC family nucleoid-associated protein n=1 Tax=Planosporangium spinosum TaxID=3402278 RepID=UPI003CEAE223
MDLSELADYAYRQVERIERMQADLAEASAEGESRSGRVRARTGPGGAVLNLHIEPAAMTLSPTDLAAEVTEAITAAQRSYGAMADEIMAPVLGMRPSEANAAVIEEGQRRLTALESTMDELDRRYGL